MKLFKRVALAFKSRAATVEREHPSVNCYDTVDELKDALGFPDNAQSASTTDEGHNCSMNEASRRSSISSQVSTTSAKTKKTRNKKGPTGWKLATYDKESSEPQTMEEEFKRLKVLQSYFVLDSEGEEEFDRITNFAASLFDVPFAFVSLVDLGRQWFLSKVGLDVDETPRDIAFCAHAVISKHKILVIPDTLKDFRFENNPFVTDGPKLRFYAGAALLSQEGYKLGTLCVLDTKPRVFTETDQMRLLDLSKMVISALVARRNRLLLAKSEELMEETGETFVSTIQTLSGAAEATERVEVKGDGNLSATVNRLRLQEKLCKTTARALLEKEEATVGKEEKELESNDWANSALSMYDGLLADSPITDVNKLFDNVKTVVKSLNGVSAVTLEIEAGVPHTVSGDDLLLFRSVLSLLMHSISRSEHGSVHLRISCRNPMFVLFECEDSGKLIPEDKIAAKWKKERTFLLPIRSLVRSVGGSYGIGRGRMDGMEGPPKSIFWFKTPNEVESAQHEKFDIPLKITHELQPHQTKGQFADPFAAALLHEGCISSDAIALAGSSGMLKK